MRISSLTELLWFKSVICFLAGALLVLAFEPVAWSMVAFISLAVLFYYWVNTSARDSFIVGFCYGMGLFVFGVSWVYVSLSTYGGMPLWMGILSVLLFSALLSLFIALPGYLMARLFPQTGLQRLIVMPACWVLFEWTKSWILTGFPWMEIGYTQTTTALFSLAPIGGVYLISFSVALLAASLVTMLLSRLRLKFLIGFTLVWLGAWAVNSIQWSDAIGQPIKIGLIQGNVSVATKWQPQYRNEVIAQYAEMSQQLHQQSVVDLLIWPETALPLYRQQTDQNFWQSITPNKVALLTGLVDSPAPGQSYNAAVLYCDGQQQIYRKRHLVPFGEYLPLRFLFNWVLEYLQLPMSDFSAWQGEQVLQCSGNINLGLSICYEDAFGSEWRRNIGDATLLVNISEDAWFGDSLAPHQRLQMAQMRAREFSRPLIRSANTGPSVVINQQGEVLSKTEQFSVQSLVAEIQPQTGDTLYKRFGNWIIILSLFLVVVLKSLMQLTSDRPKISE